MLPLFLLILLSDADEARAKAVLALAAAAAQAKAKPVPVLFFERLTVVPSEQIPTQTDSEDQGSKPLLPRARTPTLRDVAALAARQGRPLVLWVNCRDHLAEADLKDCVHYHVEVYNGSREPCIVPQVAHGGWWHMRNVLPGTADAGHVRAELAALKAQLTNPPKVSIRQVSVPTPVLVVPRAAGRNC